MHQDIKTAAKNANYWAGVTTMMPLVGGFFADAYSGRFCMVLISSFIYIVALCLMTMSQLIPSLKPCLMETCDKAQKLHQVVFFLGIYLVSVGTGGHKPSLESFGADQFDDNHPEERKKKLSFFNWWNSALCGGVILGVTVIVYMQDKVSWVSSYITLTVVMGMSVILFYIGKPFYRYRRPQGNPLMPLFHVLVAAFLKRHLPHPSDPTQLHQVPDSSPQNQRMNLLSHTNKLKFLDKSAILEGTENKEKGPSNNPQSPWRLATVNQVEELKLIINMIPIWLSTFLFGISMAQTTTFFIKQGATMNRKIGDNFEIPPASMFSFSAIGMIVFVSIYDRILVPKLRRVTGNERGITILQRIGIGMALSTVTFFMAANIEKKRLSVARKEILEQGEKSVVVSMSVLWLVPQFSLIGIGNSFALVGLQEFFYGQVPESMRSLGIALYLSVLGIADILSGFLITMVDHLTSRGRGNSWFGKDLNHSRLDKFYWLIAGMSVVNLCLYVLLASRYSYKQTERVVTAEDSDEKN